MQTPVGPSLQILSAVSGMVADVTEIGLREVWERWLGPQRFSRKLQQLEKAGLIERRPGSSGLERVIRLTEAGHLAASGGVDPVARWRRPWDGRWRMVLFDVPEKHRRARLRMQEQLRRLRFGYLQDSVWITPDPAETLRTAVRGIAADAATISLIEAQPCSGESDPDFVAGAWDFARINRCYDDYLKILRALPANGSERVRKNWIQTEWRAWSRAAQADPFLPESLLPRGYRGRDAWKARKSVLQFLGA